MVKSLRCIAETTMVIFTSSQTLLLKSEANLTSQAVLQISQTTSWTIFLPYPSVIQVWPQEPRLSPLSTSAWQPKINYWSTVCQARAQIFLSCINSRITHQHKSPVSLFSQQKSLQKLTSCIVVISLAAHGSEQRILKKSTLFMTQTQTHSTKITEVQRQNNSFR